MHKLPVSVFIIAVNEGDRIAQTIESVRGFADEIIVIDSGSTDDTVKIAGLAGARVIFNAWQGYGAQKRFGEDQCRNDWLLNLDADEAVSPELAEEIAALFKHKPWHDAFHIPIVEILPGRDKPSRFAHRVSPVRLYNRSRGRYHDSPVHDRVQMNDNTTVGDLKGIVLHRSSRGIAHSIEKINRYSTMQASDMLARNQPLALLRTRILLAFPLGFLKAYFLRGYLFQGFAGFINSVNYGFSRFVRLAKVWEKSRGL